MNETLTAPAVLPAPSLDALINCAQSIVAMRGPCALNWMFFPDWTPDIDTILKAKKKTIDYGALMFANAVIDQLSAVAVTRDLQQLADSFPTIFALLNGDAQLSMLSAKYPEK